MATYGQIYTLIPTPSPAAPLQMINVLIELRNIGSSSREMWPAVSLFNNNTFYVYDISGQMHVLLAPGEIHGWFGHFEMLSVPVTVYVESWAAGDDSVWRYDDAKSVIIPLVGTIPPIEFRNLTVALSI